MTACPTVETERLILRPFRESDLDAFTAMMHDARGAGVAAPLRRLGRERRGRGDGDCGSGSGSCAAPASGRSRRRRPARSSAGPDRTGRCARAGPVSRSAGRCIPTTGARATRPKRARRRVDYAFAHHDVDVLYSVILPENVRSQAVARRLGFMPWEERVFPNAPDLPHMIWRLPRRVRAESAHRESACRGSAHRDVERVGDPRGNAVLARLGLHGHRRRRSCATTVASLPGHQVRARR